MIKVIVLLVLSFACLGKTVEKIEFKESIKVGDKNLVLNGIGIRKATWIKVKVYVGGLYTEKKVKSYEELKKLAAPQKIYMHFVRSVDSESFQNGWKEAFEAAFKDKKEEFKKIEKRVNKFNSYMLDVKKGDLVEITFYKDKVETIFKGNKKEDIKGSDFKEGLLSVWFVNAIDEGLRDGLLGKE